VAPKVHAPARRVRQPKKASQPTRAPKSAKESNVPAQTHNPASAHANGQQTPPKNPNREPTAKRTSDRNHEIHSLAAQAMSGPGHPLPFLKDIQRSFGHHNVGHFRAHTGKRATQLTQAAGAKGMAQGSRMALAGTPDRHTVAHETAHLFQQQYSVNVAGGVGSVGDKYERMADQVADRVVSGQSAVDLLDAFAKPNRKTSNGTKKKPVMRKTFVPPPFNPEERTARMMRGITLAQQQTGTQPVSRSQTPTSPPTHSHDPGRDRAKKRIARANAQSERRKKQNEAHRQRLEGKLQPAMSGWQDRPFSSSQYASHEHQEAKDRNLHDTSHHEAELAGASLLAGGAGVKYGVDAHFGSGTTSGAVSLFSSLKNVKDLAGGFSKKKNRYENSRALMRSTQGVGGLVGSGLSWQASRATHVLNTANQASSKAQTAADAAKKAKDVAGAGAKAHEKFQTLSANSTAAQAAAKKATAHADKFGKYSGIAGIVSSGLSTLRNGWNLGKHHHRLGTTKSLLKNYQHDEDAMRLAAQLATRRQPTERSQQESDKNTNEVNALKHLKKYHKENRRTHAGNLLGSALQTTGNVLSTTGIGAVAGVPISLAGSAINALPGAWKSIRQMRRDSSHLRHKYDYGEYKDKQRHKISDSIELGKQKKGMFKHFKRIPGWFHRRMLHHSIRSKGGWGLKHTPKNRSSEAYIQQARDKIAASNKRSDREHLRYLKHKNPPVKHIYNSFGNEVGTKTKKVHYHAGRSRFRRLKEWGHRKRMGAYIGYKKLTMANRNRSTEHKNTEHEQHATTILGMREANKSKALGTLGIGSNHQRNRLARAHTGDPDATFKDLSQEHKAHVVSRVMRHRGLSQAVAAMEGLHTVSEARRKAHLKPEPDDEG
jgi:hypothetical protein